MEDPIIGCVQCGAKNRLGLSRQDQFPVCGKCKSPLPWIINGTDINFRKELKTSAPVLVDFWAEWCAPCRKTAPVLEEMARERAGHIKVVKINIDQNPATAEQFNIRSIPTLMLFKDGDPVETIVGALSKDALMERLNPHLT
jgi:thioredoxin 2